MKTILLIDDSDDFRDIASGILLHAEYDVIDASCPDEAFKILTKERVDLIVCDLHMPFTNDARQREFETSYQVGIKTIQELAGVFPQMPIVALTSTHPSDLRRISHTLGNIPTYCKPDCAKKLLELVEQSFEIPSVERMN